MTKQSDEAPERSAERAGDHMENVRVVLKRILDKAIGTGRLCATCGAWLTNEHDNECIVPDLVALLEDACAGDPPPLPAGWTSERHISPAWGPATEYKRDDGWSLFIYDSDDSFVEDDVGAGDITATELHAVLTHHLALTKEGK